MSADEPVIELENVDVHFDQKGFLDTIMSRDVPYVHALDDVNLEVPPRDVVALVGESGCGKTTLGKTMIGLQRPTAGSVKYRGQDIWEARDGGPDVDIPFADIRRSLQIIHQDPGSSLNPNKRVMAILERPLKRWEPGMASEDREARIKRLLERVELQPVDDYAQRFPHQLSGGEKQRVALVRALLMNPDVILADEAVSALDVSLRVDMMDLMLDLQDEFDTSFLFVSHDLSNARYFAENAGGRIGVMYLGEIVEIGPAQQVLDNPTHPYTKILKWATPAMNPDVAEQEAGDRPPLRRIDIPDATNPPEGCRFHTRCPEAREACRNQHPELYEVEGNGQVAQCFRAEADHEYWESPPIEE
ncbi:MAG: oligopeptide/dipeptide ABC transporter ATP-binding protein [Halobacteriaceae archaeon]